VPALSDDRVKSRQQVMSSIDCEENDTDAEECTRQGMAPTDLVQLLAFGLDDNMPAVEIE
jgi:hypothetical protein